MEDDGNMPWAISATLSYLAMILIAFGTAMTAIEQTRTVGIVMLAVAGAIKYAQKYLEEQGIIAFRAKRQIAVAG